MIDFNVFVLAHNFSSLGTAVGGARGAGAAVGGARGTRGCSFTIVVEIVFVMRVLIHVGMVTQFNHEYDFNFYRRNRPLLRIPPLPYLAKN